jgi:DNA-binding CsgD family transcriptional regulator/tetratricopeptide (TPR) repeat protein
MAVNPGVDDRSLLEREDGLAALTRALDAVQRSATGQAVFVAGEAGVGKTVLVRHFCDGLRGSRLLWGGCDPLATPPPLGPFVDVTGELGGAAAELVTRGARPYEVARALLDDLAGHPGAVVVLEDLHWADDGTIDALAYLARRVQQVPALVIATYRDDELEAAHPLRSMLGRLATTAGIERQYVQPLSRAAVQALARRSGRDGEALFTATGGNPFFVTETLASPAGEVSPTLRDAVLARASPLDAQARELLDVVAAIPPQADLRLLEQTSEHGLDGLERCLEAGMLQARGQAVAFRHELARLVIEQELGPGRAVAIHRRILRALEDAGGEPFHLVHHAEAAGDDEALLRHAVTAAARSAALGAHTEAAEHYERAIGVAGGRAAGERAELMASSAQEHYLVNRPQDAVRRQLVALELIRAAGDPLREGDVLRSLSRYHWFAGDGAAAERTGAEAVALLEQLDPSPELARAYSNLSQLRMLAYETEEAIAWGERALELAERFGAEETAVHALTNIGSSRRSTGEAEARRTTLEEALRRAKAAGLDDDVGRAFANLTSTSATHRQYAQAERYLTEGIAWCDEHDIPGYTLYLLAWRAQLDVDLGRWSDASGLVLEVLADPGASVPQQIVARVAGGLLAVRTGDEERGRQLLDDALAQALPTGELQRLAPVAAARAEAAWLRRDVAAIDAETADVTELAARRAQPWELGELAVWRARAGLGFPVGEVAPPFAAELAGDAAAAARRWDQLGCPYQAALARVQAGDESSLREALTELQRLGALPAARLVSRRLRELGARDIPRGPQSATAANPGALTARELEVLALVAQGLRNVEIAQRLVLSSRTVDHHVSAILGKLGARTRGEAVAEAHRLDLMGRSVAPARKMGRSADVRRRELGHP